MSNNLTLLTAAFVHFGTSCKNCCVRIIITFYPMSKLLDCHAQNIGFVIDYLYSAVSDMHFDTIPIEMRYFSKKFP